MRRAAKRFKTSCAEEGGLAGARLADVRLFVIELCSVFLPAGHKHRKADGNQDDGSHDYQREGGWNLDLEPEAFLSMRIEEHFSADENKNEREPMFKVT